jgi:hypothetical protein
LQQEKKTNKWDSYCSVFTTAHNMSTSIYGYSPFELMHGFQKPAPNELIQFWPNAIDPADYMQKILPIANKIREKSAQLSEQKKEKDRTYRNQDRIEKSFNVGDLVAHRQLQVATGTGMGMKPRFNGPYVIVKINDDKCSATIEHQHTGAQLKAHFTNITPVSMLPSSDRMYSDFDKDVDGIINKVNEIVVLVQSATQAEMKIETNPIDQEEQRFKQQCEQSWLFYKKLYNEHGPEVYERFRQLPLPRIVPRDHLQLYKITPPVSGHIT